MRRFEYITILLLFLLPLSALELDYHAGLGATGNSLSLDQSAYVPLLNVNAGLGLGLGERLSLGAEYRADGLGVPFYMGVFYSSPRIYGKWCFSDRWSLTLFGGSAAQYKYYPYNPGNTRGEVDSLKLTDYSGGFRITYRIAYAELTLSPMEELNSLSLGISLSRQNNKYRKARRRGDLPPDTL